MNSVLAEIYSTVIPSAPFIVVAYALMWVALLAYVVVVVRGLRSTEEKMAVLEERLTRIEAHAEGDGTHRKDVS